MCSTFFPFDFVAHCRTTFTAFPAISERRFNCLLLRRYAVCGFARTLFPKLRMPEKGNIFLANAFFAKNKKAKIADTVTVTDTVTDTVTVSESETVTVSESETVTVACQTLSPSPLKYTKAQNCFFGY